MTTIDDSVTPQTHGPRRAWAAVVLLAVVGTLNYADRFLPAVLAEPIKDDLALSDTAIGVINGFGFLAVYAVLGIAIARIADRGAFGLVISTCLTLWGAMTMLGGAVQSGFQLALTRVGVAVGEAGSTPAAHAYVARNFVPERRAAPLAVITLSIPLASAASLIGGGLLAQSLGWRTAFVVMGAISVLFAPLGASRPRASSGDAGRTPVGHEVQTAKVWDLLKKPSFLAVVAGAACISFAGYSLTTFAPAYLIRTRGMSLGEVGVQYGVASGLTGILGLLIVGRVADRLSAKDPRWLLWLVAAMTAAMLPFSALAFVVDKPGAVRLVHRVELRRRDGVHGAVDRRDSATGTRRTARHRVCDLPVLRRHRRIGRAVPDRRHQRRPQSRPGQHVARPGAAHRAGGAGGRHRLLRRGEPTVHR